MGVLRQASVLQSSIITGSSSALQSVSWPFEQYTPLILEPPPQVCEQAPHNCVIHVAQMKKKQKFDCGKKKSPPVSKIPLTKFHIWYKALK